MRPAGAINRKEKNSAELSLWFRLCEPFVQHIHDAGKLANGSRAARALHRCERSATTTTTATTGDGVNGARELADGGCGKRHCGGCRTGIPATPGVWGRVHLIYSGGILAAGSSSTDPGVDMYYQSVTMPKPGITCDRRAAAGARNRRSAPRRSLSVIQFFVRGPVYIDAALYRYLSTSQPAASRLRQ